MSEPIEAEMGMMINQDIIDEQHTEITRLRAALAEAKLESDERYVRLDVYHSCVTRLNRVELELKRAKAALTEAERGRDEARDDRLRYRCQVNALEQLGIAAEEAWKAGFNARAGRAEADLAAAREVIEIIAGRRQCVDNLMSNAEIACAFLERTKGGPLPMIRCDRCDNRVDEEWDFCPFCGEPNVTETKGEPT
jgi:hypothetical protein